MATYTYTVLEAEAQCENCDWKVESKNAQALAKIHAKRYGHDVCYSIVHLGSYNFKADGPTVQKRKKTCARKEAQ